MTTPQTLKRSAAAAGIISPSPVKIGELAKRQLVAVVVEQQQKAQQQRRQQQEEEEKERHERPEQQQDERPEQQQQQQQQQQEERHERPEQRAAVVEQRHERPDQLLLDFQSPPRGGGAVDFGTLEADFLPGLSPGLSPGFSAGGFSPGGFSVGFSSGLSSSFFEAFSPAGLLSELQKNAAAALPAAPLAVPPAAPLAVPLAVPLASTLSAPPSFGPADYVEQQRRLMLSTPCIDTFNTNATCVDIKAAANVFVYVVSRVNMKTILRVTDCSYTASVRNITAGKFLTNASEKSMTETMITGRTLLLPTSAYDMDM